MRVLILGGRAPVALDHARRFAAQGATAFVADSIPCRLSGTSPMPNNGAGSSGSNLGPTNPALIAAAQARIDALKAADPDNSAAIPVDLVTASGSGLDPHISPAAALYQVARVAHARHIDPIKLNQFVLAHVEGPQWGIFGEARVNVLLLNLDLDRAQ